MSSETPLMEKFQVAEITQKIPLISTYNCIRMNQGKECFRLRPSLKLCFFPFHHKR